MQTREIEDEEGSAYDVVVVTGDLETTHRRGLSHSAAMSLAEELQRSGKIVRVMHVVASGRYEVDRYPLR